MIRTAMLPPISEMLAARSAPGSERRILALVLPDLLEELVWQSILPGPVAAPRLPAPRLSASRLPAPRLPASSAGRSRREPHAVPRAVVLSELPSSMLEPSVRLDAVNAAARQLGVSTRQTIAQASARVGHLALHVLHPACVSHALKRVAEAALGFGSPVSFCALDTVWVDVSGTSQLFGGERELALGLAAHVRALGHSVRVACAPGPWLAQSFARHSDFDETGVFLVDTARARSASGALPIGALPISSEAVAWFARLGLLNLDDLRKLPRQALAARLEAQGLERTLALIEGRDEGVLDTYLPEALPFEEQSWDFPLESVEPLLFVLKGLAARLGARLEGRGQAAQELLLGIRYDKGIAALRSREGEARLDGKSLDGESLDGKSLDGKSLECLEIPFRLASPLARADDLERIVRCRLQKETLFAPSSGMRLQVTAITEARQWQQSLWEQGRAVDTGLGSTLSTDPRTLAVLMAELSADIGEGAVGMLEAHDSHLLEKSSQFVPIHRLGGKGHALDFTTVRAAHAERSPDDVSSRHPTRLISPIEFRAPLREKEIIVLDQRAYVIEAIVFEERLEAVEWWASAPVSRDYFRLWLASVSERSFPERSFPERRGPTPVSVTGIPRARERREGLEVLAYLNRDDGKKYVQALYD